jgi:hypothetical protein
MSAQRDKLWYLLHDRDGRVAELDIKLDRLDIEIDGLQRSRYEETKTKLEKLGIDTSNYRPPPPLLASEQRCLNHIRPDDDIEALVIAATETPLDRAYREYLATRSATDEEHTDNSGQPILWRGLGQVLAIRCWPAFPAQPGDGGARSSSGSR